MEWRQAEAPGGSSLVRLAFSEQAELGVPSHPVLAFLSDCPAKG